MGALKGSLTVSKFYVQGDLPSDFRRNFLRRIRLRTFEPLKAEEEAEERYGWCVLGAPTDLDLTSDKVFQPSYITLGLRHDKWRFPASLLHAQLQQATQEARSKTGQEKLSRAQTDALKQRVVSALKRRLLPTMRQVDVVWNLDRNEVMFWSQTPALMDRLTALFESTFSLELAPASPYMNALKVLPGKATDAALADVTLTPFHDEARQLGESTMRHASGKS